jgi:hypothetical protein
MPVTVSNLLTITATEDFDVSNINASIAANVELLLQAIEANDFSNIDLYVAGASQPGSSHRMITVRRRM